ncbi:MAG: hypothetical protein GF329_05830 [Candidatus Lokiarchaeota archaeon]|nr:hypothetical protein [Candidatus Lokiarchaeota archaeon]
MRNDNSKFDLNRYVDILLKEGTIAKEEANLLIEIYYANDGKSKKFKCKECGKCCESISKSTKRQCLKNYNKNIETSLILFLPYNKAGFCIFPWEVKNLKRLAGTLGITLEFTPLYGYLSAESNLILNASYTFNSNRCHFLSEDKRCLIYEERPQFCKGFPVIHSGLLTDYFLIGNCPRKISESSKPLRMSLKDRIMKSYSDYGVVYLDAIKTEILIIETMKLVKLAQDSGNIKLTRISSHDMIDFISYEKKDIVDYSLEEGIISEETLNSIIQNIKRMNIAELLIWLIQENKSPVELDI